MKRVFITGISGFLGTYLAMYLRRYYQVYGIYLNTSPTVRDVQNFRCNMMNQRDLNRVLSVIRPDVIIHAAAVKDIAFCETHNMYVEDVNVGVATFFAKAHHLRFHIIYISDALVFSGNSGSFHSEEKTPQPANVYAFTKRRAEELIMANCPRWTIFRLGALYGITTKSHDNLVDEWSRKLIKKEKLEVVADRFMAPTYVEDVGPVLRFIIESQKKNGVFHYAGSDRVSDYAMALEYAKSMGYDSELVTPITLERSTAPKGLGKDTSLSSNSVISEFGIYPHGIEAGFYKMRQRLQSGWTDCRDIVSDEKNSTLNDLSS